MTSAPACSKHQGGSTARVARRSLAVALLAASVPAMAQTGTVGTAPLFGGGARAPATDLAGYDDAPSGGVTVNGDRGFSYGADLIVDYESNLLRLGANQPLGGGRVSRDDFRYRPSVFARAGLPFGRQILFANASYGRDFYQRNTILDAQRFRIDAGAGWSLARCGGRLQGGYSQRQGELDLFDTVIPNIQKRTNLLASFACPGQFGVSPQASVQYNRTDNDLPLRQQFDSRGIAANGGISYNLPGRGSISLTGNYGTARFPNNVLSNLLVTPLPGGGFTLVPTPIGTLGSRFYGANIGANYRLGSAFTVSVGGGYSWSEQRLTPLTGGAARRLSRSGYPVYNASLAYRGPRITGSVGASRSIIQAPGGTSAFYVTSSYNVVASYDLGRNSGVTLGASRVDRQFRGELDQGAVNRRDTEKADRLFASYDTKFGRLLSAGVQVTHSRRRAIPSIYNYDSTGVRLRVGVDF